MNEMIERVARALSKPEDCVGPDWDTTPESHKKICYEMAKDAIAAMREPTDAMCEAGIGSGACDFSDNIPARPEAVWQAMIDEALRDA